MVKITKSDGYQEEINKLNNIFKMAENETIPFLEKNEINFDKVDKGKTQSFADDLINLYTATENSLYASVIASFILTLYGNIDNGHIIFNDKENNLIDSLFKKWPEITKEKKINFVDYDNFKKDVTSLQNPPLRIDKDKVIFNILEQIEISFELDKKESFVNNLRVLINSFLRKTGYSGMLIKNQKLSEIEPLEFEYFVARLFSLMGYDTKVTSGTGDYGIDIVAKKENETIAIQCKKYDEIVKVGNREIQMFLGAIQLKGYTITKGIFITTSDFTNQAYRQADGNNIELWNGHKLKKMIDNYLLEG